jgi:hypothetical protein
MENNIICFIQSKTHQINLLLNGSKGMQVLWTRSSILTQGLKKLLFFFTQYTDFSCRNDKKRFSYNIHFPHRHSWHGLTTPLFLTFCLQIYFQSNFFISLLFHLFFLILTCSCQYSYNLMSTSNCMCRPYIDTKKCY